MPDQLRKEAASLLKMNANKKLVQQKMVKESGNVVLLKDLNNIRTASHKGKSRNDLDETIKSLMDKFGKISLSYFAV